LLKKETLAHASREFDIDLYLSLNESLWLDGSNKHFT